MKLKKLLAVLVTGALAVQAAGVLPLQASAAAYDPLVQYEAAWSGRAVTAAMAAVGEKLYAYIGRMTAGQDLGGLAVLDVTDPKAPVLVQDIGADSIRVASHEPSREKVCVKDGYLFVQNQAKDRLEVYRINEADGKIDEGKPVVQLSDGFGSGNASLRIYGDYLFAVGQNGNASLRIYNIENPAQPREITPQSGAVRPAMATENITEQIATFAADYMDLGNGSYRMFATNRVKRQNADAVEDIFLLSVRDITIADGKYTVNTLYEGHPENSAFAGGNSGRVYDVDVVDENCIVVVDGASGNEIGDLELLDVSDPQNPKHMAFSAKDYRGTSAVVDGDNIFLATQNKRISVQKVQKAEADGKPAYRLEHQRDLATLEDQGREVGVYAGFLYAVNNKAFLTYEYKIALSIDAQTLTAAEPVVTGVVGGVLPGDSVIVTVNGTAYTAEVRGSRFSAAITERISGDTVTVEAQLIRDGQVLETAAKTLAVEADRDIVYNNVTGMQLLGSMAHGTGGRATDAVGLTIGGRKLVYVYTTAGLVVYNVTNPQDIKEVQRLLTVKGKVFNSQMQMKDGYLILLNDEDGNKVQFYKIGADGLVAETPAWTVGGNNGKESTIEIVDNYLFEAMHGAGGKKLNVYDVSNIAAGVPKVGNTENGTGVHALEVQKVSDTQYRLYYIARSDANGWRFCIDTMTVSPDGSLQFAPTYPTVDLYEKLDSIGDFAYIGNNQVAAVFKDGACQYSYIVDVTNPAAPTVQTVSGRGLSVLDLNDEYYAIGTPTEGVSFYEKGSNTKLGGYKVDRIGQIYNLDTYDGKLLVASDSTVYLYGGLYTRISLDGGTLAMAAETAGTGVVEGYQAGDSVTVTVDGATAAVTVDANGCFTYRFVPQAAGEVTVLAALYRDGKRLLGTEGTLRIAGAYPYAVTAENTADGLMVTYELLDSSYTDEVSIYAAVYEGNKLVFVDEKSGVTASGSWTAGITDIDPQTQTVKVFVWDAQLNPAAAAYTPVIAAVAQNF